jgi:hypothetical protein
VNQIKSRDSHFQKIDEKDFFVPFIPLYPGKNLFSNGRDDITIANNIHTKRIPNGVGNTQQPQPPWYIQPE